MTRTAPTIKTVGRVLTSDLLALFASLVEWLCKANPTHSHRCVSTRLDKSRPTKHQSLLIGKGDIRDVVDKIYSRDLFGKD